MISLKNKKLKILIVCLSGVLHCILSLYLWLFIGGDLNIPTGPTLSPLVYYASYVIWFPVNLFVLFGFVSIVSLYFPVLLVVNCIGLAFFLYRYLNHGENIKQEEDNIHSRPKSITRICWILIITGLFALVSITMNIYNSPADPEVVKNPISFLLHVVFIYIALIITVVSGVAMLKGKNWARLLYVGWMVIMYIIQIATLQMNAGILPSVFFSLIIMFFLFRPKANRFFNNAVVAQPNNLP